MSLEALPLNWFDLLVIAILLAGGVLGRKRGISEELLPLLQWVAIVVVGALCYEPMGRFIAGYAHLGLMTGYILAYLTCAVALSLAFGWIKRLVGEKLVAGDSFGSFEYYLGVVAGAMRFGCMLLTAMALIHARYISPEQLAADARMQRDNFGSISFPTFGSVQQAMFTQSVTGQFVQRHLDRQLIAATPVEQRSAGSMTLGQRRERAVDEVLEFRR